MQGLQPKEDCQHKPRELQYKSLDRHTPRHGLVSLNAENSDPQYSDSKSKPHLNRLPLLSSPPLTKNAHYYSVLPKSGSPLLQFNSPRQTNAKVTLTGGQSWETKLKASQVLRGKSLRKRKERKLIPSTPKKQKDTMLTSSPLSSDEKTPEIKVSTTPPKSSASDCKRKLQLGTTEVISLLDELDTENLKDDSEDILITAIEDASTPTHGSYSEPAVDKTKKKHSLQTSKDGTEANQRSVTNIAQHLDSTDEAMLHPEDASRPAIHFSRHQEPKLTPKLNKGNRLRTTPKCSVVVKPIVIRKQETTAQQDKPNSDTELTQDWLPLCNSLKEDTELPPPSVENRVTQSVAAVRENEPCDPELESSPECHVQTPKKVATSTKKRKTRSSKSRKHDREEIESELENESSLAELVLAAKAPNKTPQLPAKARKKTPLPPSKASNKTPLSVPRSVTRSLAHEDENALDNSLMSGDDDTIEPLSDSEVESESEFESPVVRRKRRPLRNSANTPAAKRQRLTTPRMKAKLNTTGKKKERKTVPVKKVKSVATPRIKDLVPCIPQKVVSFADDDDIDPFNIAREK